MWADLFSWLHSNYFLLDLEYVFKIDTIICKLCIRDRWIVRIWCVAVQVTATCRLDRRCLSTESSTPTKYKYLKHKDWVTGTSVFIWHLLRCIQKPITGGKGSYVQFALSSAKTFPFILISIPHGSVTVMLVVNNFIAQGRRYGDPFLAFFPWSVIHFVFSHTISLAWSSFLS